MIAAESDYLKPTEAQYSEILTDNVRKSIPTFVSKLIPGKLYLVQHPLKPVAGCSDELLKYSEVKFKPAHDKLQFIVPIDTESSFYDRDKGEALAAKASGSNEPTDEFADERTQLNRLTLEGTVLPQPPGSPRYVIAIVKKDQIHLCPLQAIVQVKPTYEYLNKAESKKQAGEASADTETEDEEEATKVTVKFARNARDPNAKEDPHRQKSYSALLKEEEEEPWLPMEYKEFTPSNTKMLQSNNIGTEVDYAPLDRKNYLELMFPKYTEPTYEAATEKKPPPSAKVPISQLKQMSLPDQVKTLMINGVVLHFREIHEFLRTKLKVHAEDGDLIRTLQTASNVIQGCWVVRSDLVYPPNYVSSSNGISREVMLEARDTILSKFTETRILERKKLCKLTKLPVDEVTEILAPIARMVPRQGWEFKLQYDSEFVSKFPDVVQRQNQIWERKSEQKPRRVSGAGPSTSENNREGGRGAQQQSAAGSAAQQRRRSRTKSFSSDTDSGAESERRGGGGSGGRQRRPSSRSESHPEP